MRKLGLLLIVLIYWGFFVNADTIPAEIYGQNKSYAGQVIKVYITQDLITNKQIDVSTDTVDSNGKFNLNIPIKQTQLITIPLGIYKAILYLEPGEKYEVILPPLQKKNEGDILNPFFNPVEIYLGIKNPKPDDINLQIADFNDKFHGYLDSNYYYIFKHPRLANIDSVINSIEKNYDTIQNQFFSNFRKYNYAWLKFTTVMRDKRYVIRKYFNNQPILYKNPAYMDLFNQLFTDYLGFYMNTSEGERLFSDIALAKSPKFIKETFANNLVLLNDTLQDFVLLKGLNDAFYTDEFPLNSLLITLDSVKYLTKVAEHKLIADNIREKAMQARSGYPAPKFSLKDANGVTRTSKEYLSNYVYLSFISIESFACQEDLELLKELYNKHKNDFRMISISVDSDTAKVVSYFKAHDYDWTLLFDNKKQETANKYKVKAYPTYYLIGPEGKLLMSPAPSPAENFEWQFFNMMQEKHRSQLRNH